MVLRRLESCNCYPKQICVWKTKSNMTVNALSPYANVSFCLNQLQDSELYDSPKG